MQLLFSIWKRAYTYIKYGISLIFKECGQNFPEYFPPTLATPFFALRKGRDNKKQIRLLAIGQTNWECFPELNKPYIYGASFALSLETKMEAR